MQISIIIPCLNEAKSIVFFLSRLQKLRGHCELILVDGNSTDDTSTLAEPYVDRCITSDPGRAKQMNAGAEIAQAEILLFLHADTFLPENSLTHIKSAAVSYTHLTLPTKA